MMRAGVAMGADTQPLRHAHATGSLAQKRYVARGVEQRVEDEVVKTLVAVEGERRGAKGRG
eukprot:943363-Pleurochrysis_carterae.AAC.1